MTDDVDKLMMELAETRAIDLASTTEEPEQVLDEVDLEELLFDSLAMIDIMIERKQPGYLLKDLVDLRARLAVTIAWNRIQ